MHSNKKVTAVTLHNTTVYSDIRLEPGDVLMDDFYFILWASLNFPIKKIITVVIIKTYTRQNTS